MYISGEQGGKVARRADLRGTQAFHISKRGAARWKGKRLRYDIFECLGMERGEGSSCCTSQGPGSYVARVVA